MKKAFCSNKDNMTNIGKIHYNLYCLIMWKLLEVYPAWLRFLHPGFSIRLVIIDPFVVPKGCYCNHIHNHKNDQYDNVDDRHFPPTLFQTCQNTSFARVAVIAELLLIIAPSTTIRITSYDPASWVPHRLIQVSVPTFCRGLATTRLHKKFKTMSKRLFLSNFQKI